MSNHIDKSAQRRSMFQWLHEKANVPRRLTETFSPEYGEQMGVLRESDAQMRDAAKGLQDDLKEAGRSLKKRHYLDVAYFMHDFNKVLKQMVGLFDKLRETRQQHEKNIMTTREHAPSSFLETEAGIVSRYFQERARKLLLGQQKKEMTELYNHAKRLMAIVMRALDRMGTLRARGQVAEYLAEIDKLDAARQEFDAKYKEVHEKFVKPLMDKKEEAAQSEEPKVEAPAANEPTPPPPPQAPTSVDQPSPPINFGPPIDVSEDELPKEEPANNEEIVVDEPAGEPPSEPLPLVSQPPIKPSPMISIEPAKKEEHPPAPPKKERKSRKKKEPVAVTIETGEPVVEKKRSRKRKTSADLIVANMVKEAVWCGMSDEQIKEMLIAQSAMNDDDEELSMMLLAMAEGI